MNFKNVANFPIHVIEIILSYISNSYLTVQNIFLLSKEYYNYLTYELGINPRDIFSMENIIITIQIKSRYNNRDHLFMKKYNYYIKNTEFPNIYKLYNRRSKKLIHIGLLYNSIYKEICKIYIKKYNDIKENIESIIYVIENNLRRIERYDELDIFNYNMLFVHVPLVVRKLMSPKESLDKIK
jgi:hypothetical protein